MCLSDHHLRSLCDGPAVMEHLFRILLDVLP